LKKTELRMSDSKIKVGITHGDINGVGYEVILKAFEDPTMLELCTPVVYGSAKIAGYYRRGMNLPQLRHAIIDSAADAAEATLNFVNVIDEDVHVEPGKSTEAAGAAALAALERAVADLKAGAIDVLVTAPINKSNIQSDAFHFAGHTEYLQAALAEGEDDTHRALMVLCSENLRVALATTHLPIAQVAAAITQPLIEEKLRLLNQSLIGDFGIHAPRIAVLALNPHAGDSGLLGSEEETIIRPAIEQVRQEKIMAFGPYAADGFFGAGHHTKFDGVLAMYHDQGLAPFKALNMDDGVNLTAGLAYVRTSPDHGTAYDIAGRGEADASSMRHAIYTAIDAYRNRRRQAEAVADPLKKLYVERGRDNVVLNLDKD
jgi:4-hydroxythreonine-4-phosphate dehydrogenase